MTAQKGVLQCSTADRPDGDTDDGDPSLAVPDHDGQLSRSMILQTALAIIDRDGVDGLSMRRLSDALGRDPMVLYRHVPNKAAVLDGVVEIVLAQLSVDTADPDWAAQLRTVAHDFRRLALAHPNVVPLLVTRPLATPLGQRPPGMLRPLRRRPYAADPPGSAASMRCIFTGCCSASCMATSSTSCRRSSSDPRKPTTSSVSVCTGCRSPNSPCACAGTALASYDGAAELDRFLDLLLPSLSAALAHHDETQRTTSGLKRPAGI